MPSFGEQLRRERERCNTTIEEIASTTKIRRGYLEALERNKFDGLPGGAFGKFYIRAYAEVLGFDPQPLIDEYDRERYFRNRPDPAEARRREVPQAVRPRRRPRAWLQNQTDVQQETPPRAQPPEPPQQPHPIARQEDLPAVAPEPQAHEAGTKTGNRLRVRIMVWLALGTLAVGAWVVFSSFGNGAEERESVSDLKLVESAELPTPLPETLEIPVETAAAARPTSTPSRLSVADLGLGQRVVDRRLEGRSERFEEGRVAWFSTRVLGGKPGDSIRHVWLREGRPVESIPLELGGPHWRTHSHKTLWGIGRWSVEVRDSEDRVLATATFDCVPAGSS